MLFLNEEVISKLKPSWSIAIDVIEQAIAVWNEGDYAQPIKPYLRYRNPENRIIAMPAFIGGPFDIAGLKWIASFPSNLQKQIPRANSLTILNDHETGVPLAIIHSGMISGIRTAAVSGVVLRQFIEAFPKEKYSVGIVGFGPIGQLHASMVQEVLGDKLETIRVFDIRPLNFQAAEAVSSWQEAYRDADIFITCTTSKHAYINEQPKVGSLQLNVSLRDYLPEIVYSCPHILVDDWDEVCRENTDIENTHLKCRLQAEQTHSLKTLLADSYFKKINAARFLEKEFALFNPMGMGLFDLAMAKFYYEKAKESREGVALV